MPLPIRGCWRKTEVAGGWERGSSVEEMREQWEVCPLANAINVRVNSTQLKMGHVQCTWALLMCFFLCLTPVPVCNSFSKHVWKKSLFLYIIKYTHDEQKNKLILWFIYHCGVLNFCFIKENMRNYKILMVDKWCGPPFQ